MKIAGLAGKPGVKPEEIPIIVLAYLGDAVYELFVRQYLISHGPARIDKIHAEVVRYVRADFQARVMRFLEASLSEQEKAIVRRGRNAKRTHPAKGLKPEIDHYSTALETLIGFLYLKEECQRLTEIMHLIMKQQGEGNLP